MTTRVAVLEVNFMKSLYTYFFAAAVAVTCLSGCKSDEGTMPAACGGVVCGPRQVCDLVASPNKCKCQDGYVGATCESCASGFVRDALGQCLPAPVDCTNNPGVCGSRGTCMRGSGLAPDMCICRTGYAGHACSTCATGYVMNGTTCVASCALMATTCLPPLVCTDGATGAKCGCPGNKIGAACDQCPSGWMLRMSDNTCVQTCSVVASTCGTNKVCDDSSGTPVCVCKPGRAGDTCALCAPGYMADGAGQCVRTAPEGTTLIGGGRYQNADYLIAFNTTAGTATPLRPLPNLTNVKIATDLGTRTLYTIATGTTSTVSRLDPSTGALMPIGTALASTGLTFGGGSLYTVGTASPYLLRQIDPATAQISDRGPTNVASVQALAWQSTGQLLLARPSSTVANAAELYQADPMLGTTTMLGAIAVDGMRLRPSDSRLGMSFDSMGRLFMVTRLGRTSQEIVVDHCLSVAKGLGYDGYTAQHFSSVEINQTGIGPGGARVIANRNAMGKEIIAYASYGQTGATKATLRIETSNPETFVCISTYSETLELYIPTGSAKFAGIAVTGYRPTLSLIVDGAVPPVTRPTLHVRTQTGSVATAFSTYQFSKVYSATEWSTLRLPTYASAWDTDQTAPAALVEIDLATRTMKSPITFPGIELHPTIAPWAP